MERNKPQPLSDSTPGAVLRRAREERRLSTEEVSRSLNLAQRHIDSLENDAYEKLPGPTYVRGYLRSYALLLGLAPQPLLDAYNRLPIASQRNEMAAPAPVREVTSSDVTVKLATLLVVGLVIGLAAMWWAGQDASTARPRPVTMGESDSTEPAVTPSDADAAPDAVVAQPAPEPAAPPSPAGTDPAPTAERAPTTPAPAVVGEKPAATPIDPNAPRARLVLRVEEESWADVRDAEDRRLIYQTIPAGRVVSVEGVAPISVFLGNVDGVRVEFNGEPYDAQRHKRGQLARFTLGDASRR